MPQSNKKTRKLISVITPTFQEEDTIEECVAAVRAVFKDLSVKKKYDYEHIICDNFSTDRTREILRKTAAKDKNVKIILNARNFGNFPNTFNGICAASGDAVVAIIPADLQDPPTMIPKFLSAWENGVQIAQGRRTHRDESYVLSWFRRLFYKMISFFSSYPLEQNVGEFFLLDRKVVEYLKQQRDVFPYVRGIVAYAGFEKETFDYTWERRKKGKSKVNVSVMVNAAIDAFVNMGAFPLRLILFLGFSIAVISVIYLAVSFYFYMSGVSQVPIGVTTMIFLTAIFGGLNLVILGIIGEYVGAIGQIVRGRPPIVEIDRINF